MIYYFSESNFRGNHAGTKARNDVEAILAGAGYRPINRKKLILKTAENEEHIVSNIRNRLDFIPYYLDLLSFREKTIIIQYPMLSFDIAEDYVRKLAKNNKVIFLVHDIQSMRRQDENGIKSEIRLLNLAAGVILHNQHMEKALRHIGLSVSKVYLLDCFDYLYDGNIPERKRLNGKVAFAGNLEKSEFLEEMIIENPEIEFVLYGNGWDVNNKNYGNVDYKGSFAPDEIPGKIVESFGLVWDGDSTHGCTGKFGEYTRINNPHKLSLYIAAGLPVIVWEEAAIAEFVSVNQIGLTVSRVDHLKELLQEVDETTYKKMQDNVQRIREKIVGGQYLGSVLQQIEKDEGKK